jgi:hypothetical protein
MSFSGRTPESLLPRSDSKNPATTCKGITSAGRPCRRSLANSPTVSPGPSPSRGNGVLAIVDEDNAAAFYCWQHKDQAESLAAQPEQRTSLYPLKERSSIDTLAERVGVLNLDEELPPPKKVRHRRRRTGSDEQHLTRRDTLPSGWAGMQGPLMTLPEDVRPPRPPIAQDHRFGRSNVKASWSCCIRADDDDPPPRPRPRPPSHQQHNSTAYSSPIPMAVPPPVRRKPVPSSQPPMTQHNTQAFRPSQPNHSKSESDTETQTLLSLIPRTLSPQTTSALLAELSRPISPADEAGYIYIFWLTPSDSKPDDETASSLMDDDDLPYTHRAATSSSPAQRSEKQSRALSRYASVHKPSSRRETEAKTILLKIGRAANVHRRMTQWVKQCGLDITLIRYYPYPHRSGTSTPTRPPTSMRLSLPTDPLNADKVPHVHKVERLIHIELSDKRAVKDACENCGVVHREWFEVEATKEGLRVVDEVVRRWCGWAERQDGVGAGGGRRRSDGGIAVAAGRGAMDGAGGRGGRSVSAGAGAGVDGDGGYY